MMDGVHWLSYIHEHVGNAKVNPITLFINIKMKQPDLSDAPVFTRLDWSSLLSLDILPCDDVGALPVHTLIFP